MAPQWAYGIHTTGEAVNAESARRGGPAFGNPARPGRGDAERSGRLPGDGQTGGSASPRQYVPETGTVAGRRTIGRSSIGR